MKLAYFKKSGFEWKKFITMNEEKHSYELEIS